MKIEVKSLTKKYKDKIALKDINLTLESPSMIGLVGPNGAGKSTLMKLLVSQLNSTTGEILIDDKELKKNEKYLRGRLGYLPQEFGLYEEMKVWDFLDYMACLKGMKKNRKERIEKCIEVTNLVEKKKAIIRTLSGGQKQRIGIAQALLNEPELFIVDEPTAGLDVEERIKFRNMFAKISQKKLVILSTHIIDDVESICNKIIVIDKGQILFLGSPEELIEKAQAHVGVLEVKEGEEDDIENKYKVTSRVLIKSTLKLRIVGDNLPKEAQLVIPSLEDAYIYSIMKEG